MEKSNIVPLYKKENKQSIDNYRPIFFLPTCVKILEKIVFNSIYEFPGENYLLCEHQSGFKPSDPCECQLFSIVDYIYASLVLIHL